MEVISLNVGKPVTVDYRGKPLETGIYKMPAAGPVQLHLEGFAGDGQADLVNHGGRTKRSVCIRLSIMPFGRSCSGRNWSSPPSARISQSAGCWRPRSASVMCMRSVRLCCRSASRGFLALSSRRSMARLICQPKCWLPDTADFISVYCVKVRLQPVIESSRRNPVREATL